MDGVVDPVRDLTDQEVYLVCMRIYAAIHGFMEFDPANAIALKTGYGATLQFPIGMIETFPPVVRAWDHVIALLGDALARAGMLLVPSFGLFYWFATRFGSRSKERKAERGASATKRAGWLAGAGTLST